MSVAALLVFLLSLFTDDTHLLSTTALSSDKCKGEESFWKKTDAANCDTESVNWVRNGNISAGKNYTQNTTSENAEETKGSNSWFGYYMPNSIYDYIHDMTSEFVEKVRSVIHEEINKRLDSVWKLIVKTLSYPGTLLGKFPKDVADTIRAIGLIIICLLLNYVFWQLHLSIPFILAFDGSILLVYKIWGPARVYPKLWYLMGCVWNLVSFVWDHPYISSFVIVMFYILGLTIFIVRCLIIPIHSCLGRCRRERKLDTIVWTILNISRRLHRLEADGVHNVHVMAEEGEQQRVAVHSSTETIHTLINEVQGLKATVDEVHSSTGSIAALADETKQLKATVNGIHSDNATFAYEIQQLKAKLTEMHSVNATLVELVHQLRPQEHDTEESIVN